MRVAVALCMLGALAGPALAEDEIEVAAAEGSRAGDKGTFGIGIILGEPTGISAKLYLQDDQALQAGLGFAFISSGIHLHVDYVFHPWILQSRDSFVLPVYLGPGVRLINREKSGDKQAFALGLRGVVGLLFDFKTVPIDAFVEVAGVFEIEFDDGPGLDINAAAGARYYF
ncbi:MAG: hypothetical protein H0T42_02695 [Deltaproteobacteria bacterium]|nr:hypothetical protein [Deltaproteobacteria bacterium]